MRVLAILLVLAGLPACNMGTAGGSKAATSSKSYTASVSAMLAGSDSNNQGTCSNTNDGKFKICRSNSDPGQFRISGLTSATGLYFYPMRATPNQSAYLVETPQFISLENPSVKFTARDINYAVIVDQNYTNQMNSCLSSAAACPAYSEGFVK